MMRFPEIARMADDGAGPVWASKRRRGGNPVVGFIVGLLALFGVVMLVLSIMDRSVAEAGARMDGWIATAWNTVSGKTEEAVDAVPVVAGQAVDETGKAAEKTGDALEAGAAKTAEELKKAA
ncbi:hypothetical protein [Brevundimonas fluminis]|jgi:hypothetical protein|uniref:hypothetical protein n=1 Tax=Brevundimonas fluminis TaxID=2487274 RepID=UPI001F493126|nr:hypothetical protein [Brevundimonas fluminis]